jgi:alkaline phosphatase D
VEVFHLDLRQYRETAPATRSPAPVLPPGVSAAALRAEFPLAAALLTNPDPAADIAPMAANRSLLGGAQRAWLYDGLRTSTATWKVIVSEYMITPWWLGPHDRWEGYASERDALLSVIEGAGVTGVVFLTGDVHAAIFSRVNPGRTPPVYEFTTGPVGQSSLGSALSGFGPLVTEFGRFLNKYGAAAHVAGDGVRFAGLETPNYMVVTADEDTFTVTVRDGAGSVIVDRDGRLGTFTLPHDGDAGTGYRGPIPFSGGGGGGGGGSRRLREVPAAAAAADVAAEPPSPADTATAADAVARLLDGFAATGRLFKHA